MAKSNAQATMEFMVLDGLSTCGVRIAVGDEVRLRDSVLESLGQRGTRWALKAWAEELEAAEAGDDGVPS